MDGCLKAYRRRHLRKALPTRRSGPPSGAPCWAVLVTHAMTCNEAEGLDGRPSDSRGRSDDHRPPTNQERGDQEIGDTICERNQSAGGIFHRVDAAQRKSSLAGMERSGIPVQCSALLGTSILSFALQLRRPTHDSQTRQTGILCLVS